MPQLRQEDPEPTHTIEDYIEGEIYNIAAVGLALHEIGQFMISYKLYQEEWDGGLYFDSGFTISKGAVALALGIE